MSDVMKIFENSGEFLACLKALQGGLEAGYGDLQGQAQRLLDRLDPDHFNGLPTAVLAAIWDVRDGGGQLDQDWAAHCIREYLDGGHGGLFSGDFELPEWVH